MRIAYILSRIVAMICLMIGTINISNGWAQTPTTKKSGATGLQRRIDFGNAYIMGQSIKSGAVYLLHRKQSDIKSMLEYRENYRQEILEDFIIQEEIGPVREHIESDDRYGLEDPSVSVAC